MSINRRSLIRGGILSAAALVGLKYVPIANAEPIELSQWAAGPGLSVGSATGADAGTMMLSNSSLPLNVGRTPLKRPFFRFEHWRNQREGFVSVVPVASVTERLQRESHHLVGLSPDRPVTLFEKAFTAAWQVAGADLTETEQLLLRAPIGQAPAATSLNSVLLRGELAIADEVFDKSDALLNRETGGVLRQLLLQSMARDISEGLEFRSDGAYYDGARMSVLVDGNHYAYYPPVESDEWDAEWDDAVE